MNYNEEEGNAYRNCGECQCFSCANREFDISDNIECNRCDNGCADIPMKDCKSFILSRD